MKPQQKKAIMEVFEKHARCRKTLLSDKCDIGCDVCPYDIPSCILDACDDIISYIKMEQK